MTLALCPRQYNLLPASMLATAYLYADDAVEEAASFAETGGFVFYDEDYHKVSASTHVVRASVETQSTKGLVCPYLGRGKCKRHLRGDGNVS